MSKYVELNKNGKVINVIIAEDEFIKQLDNFKNYIKSEYGKIGMIYDEDKNLVRDVQPYKSWTLNLETGAWKPIKPHPNDDKAYKWDETIKEWVVISDEELIKKNKKDLMIDREEYRMKLMIMNSFNKNESITDLEELENVIRKETKNKKITHTKLDKKRVELNTCSKYKIPKEMV